MSTAPEKQTHPEQAWHEVFIGNYEEWFARSNLRYSKIRMGKIAYREDGTPYADTIHPRHRPFPVFVDRTEFLIRKYTLIFG